MAVSTSARKRPTEALAQAMCGLMAGAADPLGRACIGLASHHARHPLLEAEVARLYDDMTAWLHMKAAAEPCEDDLVSLDQRQARALLESLQPIEPALAHYLFRAACGWAPCPHEPAIVSWLSARREQFASVLGRDLACASKKVLQLGDPGIRSREDWSVAIDASGATDQDITVGRYAEARAVYDTQAYASIFNPAERRNVHLGLDLGVPAGTPVHAPLEGMVHSFADNDVAGDYGPTIILEHRPDSLVAPFYTLYGHLHRPSLDNLARRQPIARGQRIGWIGDSHENGGWPPHLHFQIMTDMLGLSGNFYGVGEVSKLALWKSVCPDPNLILGMSP